VAGRFPDANWVVALHHHLVEYPELAKTFSNAGESASYFYIQSLAVDKSGGFTVLPPERVDVPGTPLRS